MLTNKEEVLLKKTKHIPIEPWEAKTTMKIFMQNEIIKITIST